MAVKAISAATVIRRNFGASTTTIRETQLDLGIRPAQSELAELLKVTLSVGEPVTLTGAIASAQSDNLARQEWCLSTETGRTTMPDQQYESGAFWYRWMQENFQATAAATIAMTRSQLLEMNGVYVPNPPVIIAANTISLYDILVDPGTLGTAGVFAIEVVYRLVAVDAATLAALLSRADLFL